MNLTSNFFGIIRYGGGIIDRFHEGIVLLMAVDYLENILVLTFSSPAISKLINLHLSITLDSYRLLTFPL